MIARSVYWLLWFLHSAGMGFGDVRLAALLGFSLGHVGWPELGVGMYAGFLVFGVLPGCCSRSSSGTGRCSRRRSRSARS